MQMRRTLLCKNFRDVPFRATTNYCALRASDRRGVVCMPILVRKQQWEGRCGKWMETVFNF